jgi:3-isopropylmalate dehydrogenase
MTVTVKKIILLNGDGVGPEVVSEAQKVLLLVNDRQAQTGIKLEFTHCLIGGCAIDSTGVPLPDSTLQACKESDAILLGTPSATYHRCCWWTSMASCCYGSSS